jgi:RNA polymerase sigma-70 factor (ECF subfamily)
MTGAAIGFVDDVAESPMQTVARRPRPEGFAAAVLGHRPALIAFANLLTHDRVAADDLFQDTFERALRCAWQFRPGSNLPAWLRRIMRNLFTDRCRCKTRFVSIEDQDAADHLMFDVAAVEPAEPDYRQFVTLSDIELALDSIGRPLRDVFILAYLKRLPYQTIAARLDIPLSTVGSRLWRARAHVRGRLAQTAQAAVVPIARASSDRRLASAGS